MRNISIVSYSISICTSCCSISHTIIYNIKCISIVNSNSCRCLCDTSICITSLCNYSNSYSCIIEHWVNIFHIRNLCITRHCCNTSYTIVFCKSKCINISCVCKYSFCRTICQNCDFYLFITCKSKSSSIKISRIWCNYNSWVCFVIVNLRSSHSIAFSIKIHCLIFNSIWSITSCLISCIKNSWIVSNSPICTSIYFLSNTTSIKIHNASFCIIIFCTIVTK